MDGRPSRSPNDGDTRPSRADPHDAPGTFRRDPCRERRKPRRCEHG